jgi:uncharacterized protein YndB with AHSA1/START domain
MTNIAKDKKITVTITRIFNVPRELVFKAWTDQKQMAKWWGPHGFTNPICEIDARPNGKMRICMDSPEFPNHWMSGVFTEVVEPQKLVFTTKAFEDEKGNARLEGINTVIFEEYNGKTKLTLTATLTKLAPELQVVADGMETGWNQSLEKLATLLANKNNDGTSDRELSITRLLNAPRELVWKVWTEPEHIAKWWGPEGFTNTIFAMDVKPNGVWDFVMHGPDGTNYKNTSVYVEIIKPEKLVFNHVTAPKFNFTITFTEQGDKTLLEWKNTFESAEELKRVIEVFKADVGMKQNVDKLERYLANM